MNVYSEIAVMVLVFCACWGGLALAKAAHQREGAEGEALSRISPASSRMAATALRTQVRRDVSQRFRARLAERGDQAGEASGGPAALRAMGAYAPTRDRRSQVGVMPKGAA